MLCRWPYFLLHYTYGMDYTLKGEFTPGKYGEWRFDKRTYHQQPPPRNLGMPPAGIQNELVRLAPFEDSLILLSSLTC